MKCRAIRTRESCARRPKRSNDSDCFNRFTTFHGDICKSRLAQLFHAKSLTAPASDRNLHLLNSLFHSFTFHFALKSANPIPASTLHWKSCYRTPSDLLLSRKPHQPTATQTASATILLADPGAITLAPSVGRPQISPKACHSGV